MKTTRSIQHGFTLVSAIFLLVVIAALGVFAVTLSTTQQQSSALDVTGARAYQAARAGTEWGLYEVLQGGAAASICSTSPGKVNTVAMPSGTTLSSFTVSVTCIDDGSTSEGGSTLNSYQLTSTATTTGIAVGGLGYVERQVTVKITK